MKITNEILTVIIPTYNEVGNIDNAINKISKALDGYNFRFLFVDDNSDDGTLKKINKFKSIQSNVDLIVRVGRRGLSGACIEGILNAKTPYIAIMDCDLQHDENLLKKMLNAFINDTNLDLVIGSRHTKKGSAKKGFSFVRELGSKLAIKFTKIILRINVSDPMSGFFMVKRSSIISKINKLQPNGFKILTDIIATNRNKLVIRELGYEFKKRHSGSSKMSVLVVLELIGLILSHLTLGIISVRFFLFGLVGFSGIFVQLISTYFLLKIINFSFFYSHLISIIITMTSNFFLNNALTFKDHSLIGRSFLRGLMSFYIICSIGAFANIAVAEKLFSNIEIWYFASFIGALVGALWNFIFSSIFTWKIR